MEILVDRAFKKEKYTIGRVFIDGAFFCNSLEDTDRGLSDDMSLSKIKTLKKYGDTAIPTGRYDVGVYFWPKYRKEYPIIKNVKGFEGILMHGGLNATHTLGCVLLGENKIKGGLVNCEKYVRTITKKIKECLERKESVCIIIR